MVDGISPAPKILDKNAELILLFLCVTQAENDLNELKALMHSPNAIVVRPPDPAACTLKASGTSVVEIVLIRVVTSHS